MNKNTEFGLNGIHHRVVAAESEDIDVQACSSYTPCASYVVTSLKSSMFSISSINTFLMCHYQKPRWPVLNGQAMLALMSLSASVPD